jgi:protein SCO1/2
MGKGVHRTVALTLALFSALALADVPPPPAVQNVKVTEHLGEQIPTDLQFTDSNGHPFRIADVLASGKPVLLTLAYYHCPMLCGLVMSGEMKALRQTDLELGKDYRALTVSIDPDETSQMAAEKKRGYLQDLGYPDTDPNWIFATGQADQVKKLADAIGFGYSYDRFSKQYAHNAVIMFLSPDGRVTRYLYGVNFAPKDVSLALLEASHGKVGTSLDRVILQCFRFDPATRKYGFDIMLFMRAGALTVLFSLATLLFILWRREVKTKRGAHA